VTKHFAFHSIS